MKNDFDPRIFMTSVRLEAGEQLKGGITPQFLRQLLHLQGESFLCQAYRVFLGRAVDAHGLAGYGPLADSLAGRLLVILALALSPERVVLPRWLGKTLRGAGRLLRRR